MLRKYVLFVMPLLAVWAGGCGGYYTMTVGDFVGPIEEESPVVARLQRNDFFVLNLAVRNQLLRFRVADGQERAAYTDQIGYAGTTLPAPTEPGRYVLNVDLLDNEGEELHRQAFFYAWKADWPIVAVDADGLPGMGASDAPAAAEALQKIALQANLVYFTRRAVGLHEGMHGTLERRGYPDGPILLWQREYWHLTRDNRLKMPRIIVESRLVSQLSRLKESFPKLQQGIATSKLAVRSMTTAGLNVITVGPHIKGDAENHRDSWNDLEQRGL